MSRGIGHGSRTGASTIFRSSDWRDRVSGTSRTVAGKAMPAAHCLPRRGGESPTRSGFSIRRRLAWLDRYRGPNGLADAVIWAEL